MHIPLCETREVDVLSFESALCGTQGEADYDKSKWLYVPDFYSEYRYILGTRGEKPLICIGINPSTARPDKLDNTLRSVERIALGNGFDSFIMFNVYAQRATDPDDMEPELNLFLHEENMKAFEYVLRLSRNSEPCVWAAWGTIIEKRSYLSYCVKDMIRIGRLYRARWVKAGKCSVKGHPHHPLYLPKTAAVEPFDIDGYISSLL